MAETTKNSRVSYSPVRMSCLDKERKATDLGFLILLFITFSAWIILCCIAIFSGKLPDSHNKGHGPLSNEDGEQTSPSSTHSRQFTELIDGMSWYTIAAFNNWGITIVVLGFLTAGLTFLVFLVLVRVVPKVWARIAIGFMVLGILSIAGIDIFLLFLRWSLLNFKQFWEILKINTYGVICVLSLISVSHVGVEIIAQYIRKTCRALFYFPSAFLFGLFLISLDMLITITTVIAQSTDFDNFSIAISFCSFYLHNFIYFFGIMVYAQLIGKYHAMENEDTAPKRALLHAVRTVSMYHTGTAAFAATIILPFFLGIYVLCKHTAHYAKTTSNSFIEIAWKILLLFGLADFALVITAFHGMSLFDASKKVFAITSKKSPLALAVTQILGFIMAIGILVSLLMATLVPYLAYDTNKEMDSSMIILTVTLSAGSVLLLMLPVFLLVAVSGIATLLYYIEGDDDNESRERPSQLPLNGMVTY